MLRGIIRFKNDTKPLVPTTVVPAENGDFKNKMFLDKDRCRYAATKNRVANLNRSPPQQLSRIFPMDDVTSRPYEAGDDAV